MVFTTTINIILGGIAMICIGIDVSKGKSTVCIMKPYGEIISRPYEIMHIDKDLEGLVNTIKALKEDAKVVMEATGIYHLPVLTYLQQKKIFVSVINPFVMKKYRCQAIRKGKTDKLDSITIANYGLDNWFHLEEYKGLIESYAELKLLSQQYRHYMNQHICGLLELTHMLDYTMPGIKELLNSFNEANGKDKLSDFVDKYWHYDEIKKMSKEEFIDDYNKWAKEKGYHPNQEKATEIHNLAMKSIPTLDSTTSTTKMIVRESVRVLKEIDATLYKILTLMQEIASKLPEYKIVREMNGVGEVLSAKLIAEIGDVRRFHNGKALIAYAGIDAPPYQSGQFTGTNRRISKRGSASLRKVGYETMRCLKTHKYIDDPVYNFIIKKECEGKAKKVAKIAGLNKFLRIYYARVMELYKQA